MRRYSFPMEKILELRSYKEKEISLELAEVAGRYVKLAGRISELTGKRKKLIREKYENGMDVNFLLNSEYLISGMKNKILDLEKELEKIGQEREKVRLRYVEALKDKKVMEKLKEKREAEFIKNEMKNDYKTADDMMNDRFRGEVQ